MEPKGIKKEMEITAIERGSNFMTTEELRKEAERQRRIATSFRLAFQAEQVLEDHPQRSLLLSVEALNVIVKMGESRVWAAEQALRNALAHCGGLPLIGHEDGITSVAISPDNRWVVTGSEDMTARLWDLTNKDRTVSAIVLRGHADRVNAVAISPDSHWLVTASCDATVRIWDLTQTDPGAHSIILRGHKDHVWVLAISH